MLMMMRVMVPVESGNAALASGRLPQMMGDAMARMKPQSAYFTADGGTRTVYFFVEMQDQSQIPAFAEPFFSELNAEVDFQPVMTADDLKKGLSQISAK